MTYSWRLELQMHARTLFQVLKQAKRACKTKIQFEKKREANRIANSQRYLKRASNQLINALKRL